MAHAINNTDGTHTFKGRTYSADEWFCFVNGIKERNVDPIGTFDDANGNVAGYFDLKPLGHRDSCVRVGRNMVQVDGIQALVKNESGDLVWINIARANIKS